jgi:hypothetical protein
VRRDDLVYSGEQPDERLTSRAEPGKSLEKRVSIPTLSAIAASKLSSGCSCLGLAPRTAVSTFIPTQVRVNAFDIVRSKVTDADANEQVVEAVATTTSCFCTPFCV